MGTQLEFGNWHGLAQIARGRRADLYLIACGMRSIKRQSTLQSYRHGQLQSI